MTYKLFRSSTVGLSFIRPQFTGSPVASDYFTLSIGTVNQNGVTSTNATTLSLPAGSYHLKASIGGDKSSQNDTMSYQWEIDGTLLGNEGSWDPGAGQTITCEYAELVVNEAAPVSVRLKCLSSSGTLSILDNVSAVYIRGAL